MPNRDRVRSSGNAFADLGLPKPDDLLAKAELTAKIVEEIQRRRLTQSQAASILGIDQPKVSALKQGHLSSFSNRQRWLAIRAATAVLSVKIGYSRGGERDEVWLHNSAYL